MGGTLMGSIGWGISAVITLVLTLILIKAYFKNKNETIKYFGAFIGTRFFLFLSIALSPVVYVLTKNAVVAGLLTTLLYVFMFISFLFPPLLFSNLQWPKLKNYYFGLILILSLSGILIAIINFSPIILSIYQEKGIVFQPIPDILPKMIYPISKIISVLPLVILFLFFAKRNIGKMRVRSLLIGLGLFWVITTIIVPTLIPPLWAGVYCSIADILIFAGTMIKPLKQE